LLVEVPWEFTVIWCVANNPCLSKSLAVILLRHLVFEEFAQMLDTLFSHIVNIRTTEINSTPALSPHLAFLEISPLLILTIIPEQVEIWGRPGWLNKHSHEH